MILETKELYSLQDVLDNRIFEQHNIIREDTRRRRLLALLVEISELANETRCFKFWSTKGPSEKHIILEEYVDGIHFLLSLGIDIKCIPDEINSISSSIDLTEVFIDVYEKACLLRIHDTHAYYLEVFQTYLHIADLLGFSGDDIKQAYFAKNEENHHRQDQNY